jgi:hypothetical protein
LISDDYRERNKRYVEVETAKAAVEYQEDSQFDQELEQARKNPQAPESHRTLEEWARREDARATRGPVSTADRSPRGWYKNDLPEIDVGRFLSEREAFYGDAVSRINKRISGTQAEIRKRADARDLLQQQIDVAEAHQRAQDAAIVEALKRQGLKVVSNESENAA